VDDEETIFKFQQFLGRFPPAPTLFTYADEGLVAELDSTGTVTRSYGYPMDAIWGNNPLWLKHSDGYAYFLNNFKGEPNRLVTRDGQVVWSGLHHGFGLVDVSPASTLDNPLRLSSQYFDEESTLHYNTYRYFKPKENIFSQEDQIRDAGFLLFVLNKDFHFQNKTVHSKGVYTFPDNNIISKSDPLGLGEWENRWECALYDAPFSGPGGLVAMGSGLAAAIVSVAATPLAGAIVAGAGIVGTGIVAYLDCGCCEIIKCKRCWKGEYSNIVYTSYVCAFYAPGCNYEDPGKGPGCPAGYQENGRSSTKPRGVR
jgi:RHS repeat-associated protein